MAISDQGRVAGTNTETFTLDGDDLAFVKGAAAARWAGMHPGQELPASLCKPENGWSPQPFTLHALTVGMFADMSSFCLAQRGDIIGTAAAAMSSIPAEQRDKWMATALSLAARQEATKEELTEFENTPLGTAYLIWASLDRDHRAEFPTPESVRDFMLHLAMRGDVGKAKAIEIQYKFLRASGRDAVKNFDGQPEVP